MKNKSNKNKLNIPEGKTLPKTSTWVDYVDSIVVFIDILGFQELINESYSKKNSKGNKEIIAKIYDSVQIIRTILNIDEQNNIDEQFDIENKYFVACFSDSIVISFPYNKTNELLDSLNQIQLLLINLSTNGIIVRGGITRGLIYTSQMFQIIFGPGLVEAYQLESKAAHYPRIILDKTLLNLCKKYSQSITNNDIDQYLNNILTLDTDGMYFIDYFNPINGFDNLYYGYPEQLLDLRNIITKGLLKRAPGIKIKYLWMKEKYNNILKLIQNEKFLIKTETMEYEKLKYMKLVKSIKELKPIL